MRVLIIGGTGLISRGIIKHLLDRGAQITMFNRGQRQAPIPGEVQAIHGDRNNYADFENAFAKQSFDVVIDMICFTEPQAQSSVRAFAGRCEQLIFCSTVCTYSAQMPGRVLVDETCEQDPPTQYGKDKVLCERVFDAAHAAGKFKVTTIRPSSTYGPGNPLIDNIEFNAVAWDRMERGLPVMCSGDGLGLWVSTHRDDCGKLFAYAALNPKTYGQSYNATRERNFTWREFYSEGASIFSKKAKLLFMPADWIVAHDPKRFGVLDGITRYHGAYDSSKARRDVPEFRCEIDWPEGARQTIEDVKRRGACRSSDNDPVYESMIQKALAAGVKPVEV
jgi:nucleoside-diphosphate-sugar epimerase